MEAYGSGTLFMVDKNLSPGLCIIEKRMQETRPLIRNKFLLGHGYVPIWIALKGLLSFTWLALPWLGSTEAQFIVPDRGDKVDYGIYRPVRLHLELARRYGQGTTLCHSRLFPPGKGL
jgi:hypothetical protein